MHPTNRIIFACDESGAKGYGDKDGSFPGEVGVFAGILMPEEHISDRMLPFNLLADKYRPSNGKLHTGDIAHEERENLRNDAYRAIRESGLPCF